MKKFGIGLLGVLVGATVLASCSTKNLSKSSQTTISGLADQAITKEQVKQEFLFSWDAYKKYAWGHDEVKPLSKGHSDWYREPLLLTPVDALDTMLVMGLDAQAAEAKELIFRKLSFDKDIEVLHFEIAIRMLGALLSSYELDGDPRLLALAVDLANRMLPVFNSPTGMPYTHVNLKTGKTSGTLANPAQVGTYLLEYGTLSKLTGNPVYYDKAKKAVVALYDRRSKIGLVGAAIDVNTGKWKVNDATVGSGTDSYYEYLLKGFLLFGDPDLKNMWDNHLQAINTYLADESTGRLWYGHANANSGRRTLKVFGALDAYFPALLALGGDLDRAARLEESCYQMWILKGIEPEVLDYSTMTVLVGTYPLRPEIIESAYYLYHYTGDAKYRRMGNVFFNSIVKWTRTGNGYADITDVRTMNKADHTPSYFFAETLKYSYLLFADPKDFDFNQVIFTTEAHPLFLKWKNPKR